MSDQVRQIKQKADIVSIIGERLKLKKAGRNFQALCPFHSEKTPSFNVSEELQIYKCFGCGESGDVFSFLEKHEGMEFTEALRYVADRVGVKLTTFKPSKEYQVKNRLLAVVSLAAEFYHYLLTKHRVGEEGRGYLKARGIFKRTIEKFQLGYAPSSWESLQRYLVGKKKYKLEDLERVGLVIRSSKFKVQSSKFYDRFRGRVMFPLADQRGQVVGFSGRLVDTQAKEAKYINTPETELYHKRELLYGLSIVRQEIKKADRVVVVEGELDMLSSWQAGVKNVVAIKGSALTEDQVRLLLRLTKNICLALDADQAGDEATKRGIELADRAGMNVRVVALSGGKDPDEIARDNKEKWKKLVRKAVNVYDFYLESTLSRIDVSSGEGKRRASRELAPIWARISNRVEQAHYIGKLAKALRVREEAVVQEVERAAQGLVARGLKQEEEREKEERVGLIDEYLLGLLFRSGDELYKRLDKLKLQWFESRAVRRVVRVLKRDKRRQWVEDGEFGVADFVAGLAEELKEVVERVWLEDLGPGDEKLFEREFGKVVKELRQRYVRRRMNRLAEQIEELEGQASMSQAEQKRLAGLQKEFVRVAQEL